MNTRLALWRYDHSRERIAERIAMAIADTLPRRVVYWAAIRLMVNATHGPYSQQEVPSLTAMDALKRWDS